MLVRAMASPHPTRRAKQPADLASSGVHRKLRQQILDGELEPGDPIPSERSLSEQLGINRHAVREALKRLQQAGLVEISQGGPTRVLDWRRTAGLEVLLDLMSSDAVPPVVMVRSVIEMRASLGVDAAKRCTSRAEKVEREAIAELAERTAEAVEDGNGDRLNHFIALWQRIVDGSGNVAYRLALNSLNAALEAHPEFGEVFSPRDPALVRLLGRAIATGDPERAAATALQLLEPDVHLVTAAPRD